MKSGGVGRKDDDDYGDGLMVMVMTILMLC
jgi:hypothetical protein